MKILRPWGWVVTGWQQDHAARRLLVNRKGFFTRGSTASNFSWIDADGCLFLTIREISKMEVSLMVGRCWVAAVLPMFYGWRSCACWVMLGVTGVEWWWWFQHNYYIIYFDYKSCKITSLKSIKTNQIIWHRITLNIESHHQTIASSNIESDIKPPDITHYWINIIIVFIKFYIFSVQLISIVKNLLDIYQPTIGLFQTQSYLTNLEFSLIAMAYIVLVLKIIFGLNDDTER